MARAVQRDRLIDNLLDRIDRLERRVRQLEVSHGVTGILNASSEGLRTRITMDNVSNPIDLDDCNEIFGTPAEAGDGFIGLVDDNALGLRLWLCVASPGDGGQWWYVLLTEAV